MSKTLYYRKEFVPEGPSLESLSRSWEKPRLFYGRVQQDLLKSGVKLLKPAMAKAEDIQTVHDPEYVRGVWLAQIPTGFGVPSIHVARSCLYTCGAMADAAMKAYRFGGSACVPVSGFHHAGYDFGGGFCTFNGLMVAADKVIKAGGTVGIFDADQHYGNGTDDIIARVYGDSPAIRHWTTGKTRYEPVAFLRNLRNQLRTKFAGVSVLLYQAGADCHVDDPLGGWMTSQQMAERDMQVFDLCAQEGIPLVWCLAGGYQEPYSKVLDLHRQTFDAWVDS